MTTSTPPRGHRKMAALFLALALAFAPLGSAYAESESRDYDTRRFEPAGFPLLAGNSDIGFEFGAVGTLSHFGDGTVPYDWNLDLVLALAVKGGPGGERITQQSYQANIDIPEHAGGR